MSFNYAEKKKKCGSEKEAKKNSTKLGVTGHHRAAPYPRLGA